MKKFDVYDYDKLVDVIYGATFFGAGGGGSISNGMDLLNTFPKDVELKVYPLSEMEVDEYSVMAAGLGSPLAMKEKGFGPEAISVVKGMMPERKLPTFILGNRAGLIQWFPFMLPFTQDFRC